MFESVDAVVWDWNGTLLNDLSVCIDSINILLADRNIPQIERNFYREVFGFPVKDYYSKIGFDFEKEPFEIPANQFIAEFSKRLPSCSLYDGAEDVLAKMQSMGKRQFILSVMEQEKLVRCVDRYGINPYFEQIVGLSDDYAYSKEMLGKQLFAQVNLNPDRVCVIGDTLHDYEVACSLGCRCILLSDGHQSEHRLRETNAEICSSIKELGKKL